MKAYLLVFLLAAALCPGLHAQVALKEYDYPEDLMAFLMPGAPTITSKDVKAGDGTPVTSHSYMFKGGPYALLVCVVATNRPLTIDGIKGDRDDFLKGMQAREVSEKNISIDGNPGIEFVFQTSTANGVARYYAAGSRGYALTYIRFPSVAGSADTQALGTQFLDSFQLTKP